MFPAVTGRVMSVSCVAAVYFSLVRGGTDLEEPQWDLELNRIQLSTVVEQSGNLVDGYRGGLSM